MKKPELLVIPVTKSNASASEIQCQPLQIASKTAKDQNPNNTLPIFALDEQNTNNTRAFAFDEQEVVSFLLSKHFC